MKGGVCPPSLRGRISARTSIKRMVRSEVRAPRGYGWVTNPRKAAYNRVYNRAARKACYVATAVYGGQDAWQVQRLRRWRDGVLLHSWLASLLTVRATASNGHRNVSRSSRCPRCTRLMIHLDSRSSLHLLGNRRGFV